MPRDDGHGHRARRDHGADGDVELARDHQEPDGQRHDAEVGRHVEVARRARGPHEVLVAEDGEEHEDEDEAEERSGLGPADQAAEIEARASRRRTRMRPSPPMGCLPCDVSRSWELPPCLRAIHRERHRARVPGPRLQLDGRGPARGGPDIADATELSGCPARRRPASARRWRPRRSPGPVRIGFVGTSRPEGGVRMKQRGREVALKVGLLVDREELGDRPGCGRGWSRSCRTRRARRGSWAPACAMPFAALSASAWLIVTTPSTSVSSFSSAALIASATAVGLPKLVGGSGSCSPV